MAVFYGIENKISDEERQIGGKRGETRKKEGEIGQIRRNEKENEVNYSLGLWNLVVHLTN